MCRCNPDFSISPYCQLYFLLLVFQLSAGRTWIKSQTAWSYFGESPVSIYDTHWNTSKVHLCLSCHYLSTCQLAAYLRCFRKNTSVNWLNLLLLSVFSFQRFIFKNTVSLFMDAFLTHCWGGGTGTCESINSTCLSHCHELKCVPRKHRYRIQFFFFFFKSNCDKIMND